MHRLQDDILRLGNADKPLGFPVIAADIPDRAIDPELPLLIVPQKRTELKLVDGDHDDPDLAMDFVFGDHCCPAILPGA